VDLTPYRHTETVTVGAPPEAVYDLVADITRMGDWSPVCAEAVWDDDSREWFSGTNVTSERSWTTKCRVDVAELGKEFTFVNCGMAGATDLVRWSYRFTPADGGTTVTEEWQVLPGYVDFMRQVAPDMDVAAYLDGVKPATQQGMRETLARLRAGAEGGARHPR
jgi:uncharacterized membrane protein